MGSGQKILHLVLFCLTLITGQLHSALESRHGPVAHGRLPQHDRLLRPPAVAPPGRTSAVITSRRGPAAPSRRAMMRASSL